MQLILLPQKHLFTCLFRISYSGNLGKFAGKKSALESVFSKSRQAATLLKKDSTADVFQEALEVSSRTFLEKNFFSRKNVSFGNCFGVQVTK